MGDMKCLVCFKDCLPNVKFEASENDVDADACHSVNRQLKTVFLLRKFLDVPEYLCWEFLQDYGNPCDWIHCCLTCSIWVDDAKRIFDEITQLRKKYENLQRKFKAAVMRSLKSEERGHLGVTIGAMRRIRNFIRNETGTHLVTDIPPVRKRTQFSTAAKTGVHILPSRDGTPESSVFENFDDTAEEAPESSTIENNPDTRDDSLEHYCTICDRNFRSDLLLKYHKRKNHTEDISAGEQASGDFSNKSETTKEVIKDKRRNICDTCEKEFSCPSHLKRHQLVHTGEKPFQCTTCNKYLSSASHLKRHIRQLHPEMKSSSDEDSADESSEQVAIETNEGITEVNKVGNPENTSNENSNEHCCDICSRKFRSAVLLKYHKRNHNPENSTNGIIKTSSKTKQKKKVATEESLTCSTCGKMFSCQSHLEIHIRTHPGLKPYVCTTCGKGFGHLSHMKSHKLLHDGIKPHKCKFCDKTFSKKSNMRSHLKVHNRENSEEGENYCKICKLQFAGYAGFKRHVLSHSEKTHQCQYCSKKCSTARNLKSHEMAHVTKKFKCDFCEECFFTGREVSTHLRTVHEGQTPFICDQCGKGFTYAPDLTRHVKRHTAEKKFECDICNKKFSEIKLLRRHLKIHTDERPCTCEICGKSFKHAQSLRYHSIANHGAPGFPCENCGKVYPSRKHLIIHKRFHTGEKPFKCKVCGRTFASADLENKHRRLHLKEGENNDDPTKKPFQCNICGRRFVNKGLLGKHVKFHSKPTL